MIFICSRGRRKLLERFFTVSKPTLPGRVLIDDDDPSYEGMELPPDWRFSIGARSSTVNILNRAFDAYPNEKFYAVVCDDMMCGPAGWDTKLADAAGSNYVAWGDDGKWGPQLCTSFFVGGDLARRMGWLAYPALGHLYVDTVWWGIADGSGIGRYVPEVRIAHTKIGDATYRERRILGDKEIFEKLKSDGLQQLIELASNGHTVHQS